MNEGLGITVRCGRGRHMMPLVLNDMRRRQSWFQPCATQEGWVKLKGAQFLQWEPAIYQGDVPLDADVCTALVQKRCVHWQSGVVIQPKLMVWSAVVDEEILHNERQALALGLNANFLK